MLNEGVFDKLAAGVAGAKAAYQAGGQQRAGQAMQKEIAGEWIEQWNKAIGQDPEAATPENLKAFMHMRTRQSQITVPEPPPQMTAAAAAAYITKVTGMALAAGKIGPKVDADTAQATQGATADQKTAPEKPTLTPGFTMVDDDPVTLKYKNQDYVRNDKGQWAPMLQPTKPIVDSAVAKVFDKQEQAIENWKAAQAGSPSPATSPAPSAPAADASTAPAAPDTRTQAELRSPKGIKDPSKEVFIPGHGIVQKQDDNTWRSLVANAPVDSKDWPALEKRLAAAGATDTSAAAEPAAEPAADQVAGAPIDSTTTVGNEEVKVTFKKSDEGWRNAEPSKSSTLHKPGTKQYDALERHWAKQNNKPQPAPTVGQSTTGQAPATKANYAQQTKGGTGYGAAGAGMANLTGTPTFKQPTSTPEPALAESFKRLNRITHGKI